MSQEECGFKESEGKCCEETPSIQLHVHHDLTLHVFLAARLATWKGTGDGVSSSAPSGGQPSPISSPRLCITSGERGLQPNPLSSHQLNTHGHMQGQEKKSLDLHELFAFPLEENAAAGWGHCVGWILLSGPC